METKLLKIDCHFNDNKCKKHTDIYIDRRLPCPYPNCNEGIQSNKFVDKGYPINLNGKIENHNKTTYVRKSWKGLDNDNKYMWYAEDSLYPYIANIIYDEVFKIIKDKTSDSIYHYTTLNTLYKILESNELWLTDWKDTNDRDEIKHGLKIVNEFNKDKLDIKHNVNNNNYFIASFSYEINKKTLFAEYADEGKGVAIEFDCKYKYVAGEKSFWYHNADFMKLMPVIYDIELQRKIMKYAFYIFDIAKEWLLNQEDYSNSKKKVTKNERESLLTKSFLQNIEEIMSFFKHDSFVDERETRWLYKYDIDFIKEYKFDIKMKTYKDKNHQNKNYYTSKDAHYMSHASYYDVDDTTHDIRLPIKSIILGSRVENKEAVISEIKEQCSKFNFENVEIKISDIPYR